MSTNKKVTVKNLAEEFHTEHGELDGTTDYIAASDFLKAKGINPWTKDPKNPRRTLASTIVHYFERNKNLSTDVDWD